MHLTDFSDRLSPMLVKELRQGLRARSFIGVFLTLQIILAVILLSAGASATSSDAGSTISSIIFVFFGIAVIIIQPMRGISAISSETKGNTIDMMVLTRLSAWRIVTGKWAAIVSQSALILVTIIPYLIFRYFFGGMNLLGEMVLLALIFLTSVTITAITVGLSASSSVILRAILPMLALPIAGYMLLMMLTFGSGRNDLIEACALDSKESRIGISLYLVTCAYLGFFVLSMGTSLIAPHAENHATLRRLISLVITIIAAVICSMQSIVHYEMLPLIFFIIFIPLFTITLSEFAILVPPIYQKFTKYGKIASLFLSPGWATGLFFCILLSAIAAIPYAFNAPRHIDEDHLSSSFSLLATLLFPAFLINIFKMKGPIRISNYILFLATSVITSGVLMGVAESLTNSNFLYLFIWIPPVLFFMIQSPDFDERSLFIASIAINLMILFPLLIIALKTYRASLSELRNNGR